MYLLPILFFISLQFTIYGQFDQFCMKYVKRVCYACPWYLRTNLDCVPISKEIRMIRFDNSTIINYETYVNSSIAIIEEPNLITFYNTCSKQPYYIQAYAHSFYPLNGVFNSAAQSKFEISLNISFKFQNCLEHYCMFNNGNEFKCIDAEIYSLNFIYTNRVTVDCVQNITSAHINSQKLTRVESNYFFTQAYKIIYLYLHLKGVTECSCSAFGRLVNIRVLQLRFDSNLSQTMLQCIFTYNPSLIKLEVNNLWLWNECKNDSSSIIFLGINQSDITFKSIFYFSVILVIILSAIGCCLCLYSLRNQIWR